MCQASNFKTERVITLKKPMTVYKVAEIERKSGQIVSYYRRAGISIGETQIVSTLETFKIAVDSARESKKNLVHKNIQYYWVTGQGIHAVQDLETCEDIINSGHKYWHHVLHEGHDAIIIECKIPAQSGVVRGLWYDDMKTPTLVTNKIKYVKIIKP